MLLAGNAFEPHHAFRVGRNAWGVQFHPEFSDEALRSYLDGLGSVLAREGLDAPQIAAALRPTPEAASVFALPATDVPLLRLYKPPGDASQAFLSRNWARLCRPGIRSATAT